MQGRFTSPDEFKGGPEELFEDVDPHDPFFYADTAEPQSINKYHYALNNPLRYVDPDGHQATLADRLKAGAANVGRTLLNTVEGAASAFAEDNLLGGTTGPQNSVGRRIGHGLALVQAGGEILIGAQGIAAGVGEAGLTAPACATGVGCAAPAVGVVVAAGGVVTATHGALVVLNTVNNIFNKNTSAEQPYENTPQNEERMRQGKAPIRNDGKPVELHHPGQKPNTQVREMTRTDHRGPGNMGRNHPNKGPSQIDRNKAAAQRKTHWKQKVKENE